ncbi:hypothetical protein BpHYR1_037208 [Brachionus plicatilis]|uniref:Uncharacterized protein n=1 Tax=Brachionus plicatilis TaxID=10195 RepID=A0A3M7QSL0_BRAPC|nr:hypothetical protein BpHYR1_037208 [Brachionus plicatilis]
MIYKTGNTYMVSNEESQGQLIGRKTRKKRHHFWSPNQIIELMTNVFKKTLKKKFQNFVYEQKKFKLLKI